MPGPGKPSVPEFIALKQALERTEDDLALVLGVLAGIWPSSICPLPGGTHIQVVIDTPAGEVAFAVRRAAAKRMWHVPEVSEDRRADESAARMRDERLVQLAAGIAPPGTKAPPLKESVRTIDRRSGARSRGSGTESGSR